MLVLFNTFLVQRYCFFDKLIIITLKYQNNCLVFLLRVSPIEEQADDREHHYHDDEDGENEKDHYEQEGIYEGYGDYTPFFFIRTIF